MCKGKRAVKDVKLEHMQMKEARRIAKSANSELTVNNQRCDSALKRPMGIMLIKRDKRRLKIHVLSEHLRPTVAYRNVSNATKVLRPPMLKGVPLVSRENIRMKEDNIILEEAKRLHVKLAQKTKPALNPGNPFACAIRVNTR